MKRPKIVRLKKRPTDDTEFVRTLVWILDLARRGKVAGYAMIVGIEDDEGARRAIELACHDPDPEGPLAKFITLGMIEKMKLNYIKRTWFETDE